MALTLAVVGKKAAQMGAEVRKTFTRGGTIGRLKDNDWVLPDEYISGRHAKITYSGGKYLIEDTSTNGVCVNSSSNRLVKGQPYTLRDGDTVYIDDYEVRVSVAEDVASIAQTPVPMDYAHPQPAGQDNPFGVEIEDYGATDSADPMKLLGLERPPTRDAGPRVEDLANSSPLQQYYRPPEVPPAPDRDPLERSDRMRGGLIPDDYDPFASDDVAPPSRPAAAPPPPKPKPAVVPNVVRPTPGLPPPRSAQRTAPIGGTQLPRPPAKAPPVNRPQPGVRPADPAQSGRHRQPLPPQTDFPGVMPSQPPAPTPSVSRPVMRPSERAPARVVPESPSDSHAIDFRELLAGAGIDPGDLTPELSQQFGQILKVVVEGLMDVLRAREKIKEEFRMRMTTFKQADNNPLKFSANVEDALHNLLVKRNKAYLGPVEAFEDAFRDVRNHQMAMLAGVRVAFDAMLEQFDPETLQQLFERNAKGGLFGSSAKHKYWELYRNNFRDMVKDADSSFRKLFGDDFAKAYEDQLARLKAASRAERK